MEYVSFGLCILAQRCSFVGWQPCLKVSTTMNFKISIKNQTFIVLGGLKCEKLANNVIKVTNKGLGTCFSKKSEQIRPFLVKIFPTQRNAAFILVCTIFD